MSEPRPFNYRADIDGLRAIAVLLVVIFHFKLVPGLESGFLGVDLFFVISGFLITSIVQAQLANGTFNLVNFWLQRVRRLAPALTATTVLTLVIGSFLLLPSDFRKLAEQTIAAQLYFANIFYWRNVNYFGLQAHDVYLLHTWSLAVEEQFYLAFPVLLLLIHRVTKLKQSTGICIIVVCLCSFILNLIFVNIKPEATFYLMPTRAWELLAGSLLAIYGSRVKANLTASNIASVLGLMLLGVALFLYKKDMPFPGLVALLPVMACALLIYAGSAGTGAITSVLSNPALVYVGKLSYPLYLVHWPINVFAAYLLGASYTGPLRLGMLFLSFLIAATVFHTIEKPAQKLFYDKKASYVFSAYGISVFVAVSISLGIIASAGAPWRFPDEVARLASYANDTPGPQTECTFVKGKPLKADTLCRLGSESGSPKWLVYGDSHAWAASAAVHEWLKSTDQSAYFLFVHSCPPVNGIYVFRQGTTCFDSNAFAVSFLLDSPNVSNVFLISTWRQAIEGIVTNSPSKLLSPKESLRFFEAQFSSTITALNQMGKKIYVWEPLPGAKANVPQAMARSALGFYKDNINFSQAEYLEQYRFFFNFIKEHKTMIAGTFAPATELCSTGSCRSSIDGNPLYFDNGHLGHSQRQFWADALKRQIPR
jgi:peptidoglycan/LPS O-acetylase OafA/YrhL